MEKLIVNFIRYFSKKRRLYVASIVLLIAFISIGISKLKLNDSIFSIFPKTNKTEFFAKILAENKLNNRIIFSIEINDSLDLIESQKFDSISQHISKLTEAYLYDFQISFGSEEERLFDFYYKFFPVFLVDSDYVSLKQSVSKDSVRKSLGLIKKQLSSMDGMFLRKYFSKDPLGLTWSKLNLFYKSLDSSNYIIEDGFLKNRERDKVFFTAKTKFGFNNGNRNIELESILDQIGENYKNKNIVLNYFSPFLIANANSKQIKKDTRLVLFLSGILIILILMFYYKSILIPLLFILSLLVSSGLSLSVIGFLGIEVSLISLAISAIVLGIVMDYSFHFFTHYAQSADVYETIKDIFKPMIIGSFTTIAAFAALMFTNSVILQDFGLVALLTLLFAVIITLCFLPVLVNLLHLKPRTENRDLSFRVPKWIARLALFSTVMLCIFFIIDRPSVHFDKNLNNLSYHPQNLVDSERSYTGLNPSEEKKVMLFVSAKNLEEALESNSKLYQELLLLQKDTAVKEIISIAPFFVSKGNFNRKSRDWEKFWVQEKDSTIKYLKEASKEQGISYKAFQAFNNWIQDTLEYNEPEMRESLKLFGLDDLLEERDSSVNIITSITVSKANLEETKRVIRTLSGVSIVDVSEMAFTLVNSVQSDFSYLILFSSLIVFLSLLVIYGRIELAIFSFFPMVVSWIWILYLSTIFSIQFNFVNIILATIIFGLGDDFSIFITDGLIKQYKTKSANIKAYKSAIILSALTTMVGTGVLIFAKHPAINSIAILSVSGIASILLVTLLVQPLVFRIFIVNRINRKYSPATLLGVLFSFFLYAYFILGCLLLNLLVVVFLFVPINKLKKRNTINYLISKMTNSTINLGFHIRKRTNNIERLDFSKPAILIANHVSFLDIILTLRLSSKIIILVNEWVYNSPLFGLIVKSSGYIYVNDNPIENIELVKTRIAEGYSIMIFPEGTRNPEGQLKRFKKGAFYLAQQLKLDIQPVLFTGTEMVNPKGDLILKKGKLTTNILERISHNDPLYNKTPRIMSKEINQRMRISLNKCKQNDYDTKVLGNRISYNYLYKGPVLEWYFRIKWTLEQKNFEFYDKLIQDREKIYDLGCGYGYLSFYLHYRDSNRQIIGFDYDKSKIEIAQNSYDKGERLNFYTENLKTLVIANADVIILTDVLHYIRQSERVVLFEKMSQNLNSGGIVIIRDGVTNIEEKHKKTIRSERYSTKYLKFNKVENELDFISINEIKKYAKLYEFTFEIQGESKSMSNVIIILRKK